MNRSWATAGLVTLSLLVAFGLRAQFPGLAPKVALETPADEDPSGGLSRKSLDGEIRLAGDAGRLPLGLTLAEARAQASSLPATGWQTNYTWAILDWGGAQKVVFEDTADDSNDYRLFKTVGGKVERDGQDFLATGMTRAQVADCTQRYIGGRQMVSLQHANGYLHIFFAQDKVVQFQLCKSPVPGLEWVTPPEYARSGPPARIDEGSPPDVPAPADPPKP